MQEAGVVNRVLASVGTLALVATGVAALTASPVSAGTPARREATRTVDFRSRGRDVATIDGEYLYQSKCVSVFPNRFVVKSDDFLGARVRVDNTSDGCEAVAIWRLTARPTVASDRLETAEVRLTYGQNRGNSVTFLNAGHKLRLSWYPRGEDGVEISIDFLG
jgi:hypothetical protein